MPCDSMHMSFVTIDSPSFENALDSSNADQWKKAINNKYEQLISKNIFEEVDILLEEKKAIGSKVVLKEKLDEQGNCLKFKACIVEQGFSQIPGINYNEMFLSVAKFTTLQIFLTLAAMLNVEIYQVDVVRVYLEGKLDEDIYM